MTTVSPLGRLFPHDQLLTSAQMRAIEQAAIKRGETSGLRLMETAGAAVAREIMRVMPGGAAAAVLCGPGSNGGDGYVVARHLFEAGWRVIILTLGDPKRLPPDAQANATRWQEKISLRSAYADHTRPLTPQTLASAIGWADVVVDALFGSGLTRPLSPELLQPAVWDARASLWVAIDAPSGLCLDSGRPLEGRALMADMTVTFHRARLGHVLDQGPKYCGQVILRDIGLSQTPAGCVRLAAPHRLDRNAKPYGHKYDYGHVLTVSGPLGRSGAARLAARAALRAGAGAATVASPPSAMAENACQLTAIMLREITTAQDLATLLSDARVNSVVIGPGCGVGADARALTAAALTAAGRRRIVLDADVLTSFAENPAMLFQLIGQSNHDVVLTPHGGEFARLFPDLAEKLIGTPDTGPAYSKVDAARDAAARSGATVLFKGPDTVVAAPDGAAQVAAAVYRNVAPWLATAGSGDVLAGLTAVLPAADAAALHQALGRHCGAGLIAEDLPEAIPALYRRLMQAAQG